MPETVITTKIMIGQGGRYKHFVIINSPTKCEVTREIKPEFTYGWGRGFIPFFTALRLYSHVILEYAPCDLRCRRDLLFIKLFSIPEKFYGVTEQQVINVFQFAAGGNVALVENELAKLEIDVCRKLQPKGFQGQTSGDCKIFKQIAPHACTFITPVHTLLMENKYLQAVMLLRNGANRDMLDGCYLPMIKLGEDGDYDCDPFLVGFGGSYLHWAARYLDIEGFKYLITCYPTLLRYLNFRTNFLKAIQGSPILWALENKNIQAGAKIVLFLLDQAAVLISSEEAYSIIKKTFTTYDCDVVRSIINHNKIRFYWQKISQTTDVNGCGYLLDTFIKARKDAAYTTLLSLGLRFNHIDRHMAVVQSIYDFGILEKVLDSNIESSAYNNIINLLGKAVEYNNVIALKILRQKGLQLPININLLDYLRDPSDFVFTKKKKIKASIERHYEMVAYLIRECNQDPYKIGWQGIPFICSLDPSNIHTLMAFYNALGLEAFRKVMATKINPKSNGVVKTIREYLIEIKDRRHEDSAYYNTVPVNIIGYLFRHMALSMSCDSVASENLNEQLEAIFVDRDNFVALTYALRDMSDDTGFIYVYDHLQEYAQELQLTDSVKCKLRSLKKSVESSINLSPDPDRVWSLVMQIDKFLARTTEFLFATKCANFSSANQKQCVAVSLFRAHQLLIDEVTIMAYQDAESLGQIEFVNQFRQRCGLRQLRVKSFVPGGEKCISVMSTAAASSSHVAISSLSTTRLLAAIRKKLLYLSDPEQYKKCIALGFISNDLNHHMEVAADFKVDSWMIQVNGQSVTLPIGTVRGKKNGLYLGYMQSNGNVFLVHNRVYVDNPRYFCIKFHMVNGVVIYNDQTISESSDSETLQKVYYYLSAVISILQQKEEELNASLLKSQLSQPSLLASGAGMWQAPASSDAAASSSSSSAAVPPAPSVPPDFLFSTDSIVGMMSGIDF